MQPNAKQLDAKYRKNYSVATPFIVACEKGVLEDVRVFLNDYRGNVKFINQKGNNSRGNPSWSGLLAACIYEKENVVEYLLRQDLIDISIVHKKTGCNGLHFAASWCTSTRILGLLLSHTSCSFDIVNCRNASGRTPLDCVQDNPNHIQNNMITMLRSHGGRTGTELEKLGLLQVNEAPMTLEKAIEVTQELEEKYLSLYRLGTPFIVACEKGQLIDVKTFVEAYNVTDYLLNASCARTSVRNEAIHINQKGKTSYTGYFGKTGLIAACGSNHPEIAEYLLAQPSIDVSATDQHGWNCLHWSASFSGPEIVTAILSHSACTIDVINKQELTYGLTPLDKALARKTNHAEGTEEDEIQVVEECIRIIRSKGGMTSRAL